MRDQYLLYIDILGFTELAQTSPERVDDLYQVIASLNAHNHPDFATIVFSDTVLVQCLATPNNAADHEYVVMYMCEFVQDLLLRLVGRDISFRAVLTFGQFDHYYLNNVPCFFGPALIHAYNTEKRIQATGLFIDDTCNRYNAIFPTLPYRDGLSFVFLTQNVTEFEDVWEGRLPLPTIEVVDSDTGWFLGPEVLHLQHILARARSHPVASVRSKYAATWRFYEARYPRAMSSLEAIDFRLERINKDFPWDSVRSRQAESYESASQRKDVRPR